MRNFLLYFCSVTPYLTMWKYIYEDLFASKSHTKIVIPVVLCDMIGAFIPNTILQPKHAM